MKNKKFSKEEEKKIFENIASMGNELKDAIYEKWLGLIFEKADYIYESITGLKKENNELTELFEQLKKDKIGYDSFLDVVNPNPSKIHPLESKSNNIINFCVDFKYLTDNWDTRIINIIASTLIQVEVTKTKDNNVDFLPKLQTKLRVHELINGKRKILD